MQSWIRTPIAIVVALMSLGAVSDRLREPGVTETEIRIGNVMPYSGSLEVFGAIGKAEAAYFEMINGARRHQRPQGALRLARRQIRSVDRS